MQKHTRCSLATPLPSELMPGNCLEEAEALVNAIPAREDSDKMNWEAYLNDADACCADTEASSKLTRF